MSKTQRKHGSEGITYIQGLVVKGREPAEMNASQPYTMHIGPDCRPYYFRSDGIIARKQQQEMAERLQLLAEIDAVLTVDQHEKLKTAFSETINAISHFAALAYNKQLCELAEQDASSLRQLVQDSLRHGVGPSTQLGAGDEIPTWKKYRSDDE